MARQRKRKARHAATVFYSTFDPNTLSMLEGIIEEALQELAKRKGPIVDEPTMRELLAHRVMARASHGELDPERLKQHALWGMLH